MSKSLSLPLSYLSLAVVRPLRAQELCESRGGRPGLPVPNSRYSLCGRKPTLEEEEVCPQRPARSSLSTT